MDAATEMYSNLEDNDLMSIRETVQILEEHSFTLAEFADENAETEPGLYSAGAIARWLGY